MSLQLCFSRWIEADSQLWVLQMKRVWSIEFQCRKHTMAPWQTFPCNLARFWKEGLDGWCAISSVSVWCLLKESALLRDDDCHEEEKEDNADVDIDVDDVADQLMRICLVSRGMSISAGPKWWSSRLILSSPGAVPLIADVFGIWFSQVFLPLEVWKRFLRLLSLSLPLCFRFILFSCNSTRQGWRACSRGKRHHEAWVCLGAPGDWERGMWMGSDKWLTYRSAGVWFDSCQRSLWKAGYSRDRHWWVSTTWQTEISPWRQTDTAGMATMEMWKLHIWNRYLERRNNGSMMIHAFWAEMILASRLHSLERFIVGRCRFEALGWLWQDQVLLRLYLLRGGWCWCARWQKDTKSDYLEWIFNAKPVLKIHGCWCAPNLGGLHRDVFVSSLGTHFDRSFPLKDRHTY